MALVTLPDPTKLDNEADKISSARPEIKLTADAVVEMGTAWNNNGGSFGDTSGFDSETIDTSTHDGVYNLDNTKTVHILNCGTIAQDSAGDTKHIVKLNLDNLLSATAGERHTIIIKGTVPVNIGIEVLQFINNKRARGSLSSSEIAITLPNAIDIHAYFLTPVGDSKIFCDQGNSSVNIINEVLEEGP